MQAREVFRSTYDKAPDNYSSDGIDSVPGASKGLAKGSGNHNDKLSTVFRWIVGQGAGRLIAHHSQIRLRPKLSASQPKTS